MQGLQRGNSGQSKQTMRQSNLELLRIISMMMIVLCHFFYYNKFSLDQQPMGLKRIVLKTFLGSQGRVGVDIFFAISIWFLCKPKRQITFHDAAKRAWILERTLLFWSVILGIACMVTEIAPKNIYMILNTILPTLSNDWGYATCYIVILLLMPFAVKGLACLSRQEHMALCAIIIFIGPVMATIPGLEHHLLNTGLLSFLALLTLVTYIRWYRCEPAKPLIGVICLAMGYFIIGVEAYFGFQVYEMMDMGILLETLGWFILFSKLRFSSRFVNWIASHVFAIYLITEFIPIRQWLWGTIFDYGPYYHGLASIFYPIAVTLLISAICILFDIAKSAIFKLTVDRNKGHWFELLWSKISMNNKTIRELDS
ncbi:acyltransferase [Bifidobacterium sp. ESL0690]|uniref:acyltransferase family protein n=1 Tax=Bifidobacterium sp. ESL0690 TaxID=2983214 RepID=UPI0023F98A2C|nr:acyltransferase [Bifidobacterium sp. ESL0690]WEV46579.1 acyltransferase [Bifidobacterium sp. ESL0690]